MSDALELNGRMDRRAAKDNIDIGEGCEQLARSSPAVHVNCAKPSIGLRVQLGAEANWAPGPTGPRKFETCFPARDEAKFAL